jgi:methyl-accepting chemotaxis protein
MIAPSTREAPGLASPARGTAVGEMDAGVVVRGQISDLQTAIAGAVEEQTATTNEMSRNVNEATRGVETIAENSNRVAAAAGSTATAVSGRTDAETDLARLAEQLDTLVGRFRCQRADR